VIVFVALSLWPALSTTRTATVQSPGAGAVAVTLLVRERISNPGWPSKFQSVLAIGVFASVGVDVEVNVTVVPDTTGFGAQSKSAVGGATASPIPSGDTTAPTVAKKAVRRSLRRPIRIRLTNVGVIAPLAEGEKVSDVEEIGRSQSRGETSCALCSGTFPA
jgi:hypothetical protein